MAAGSVTSMPSTAARARSMSIPGRLIHADLPISAIRTSPDAGRCDRAGERDVGEGRADDAADEIARCDGGALVRRRDPDPEGQTASASGVVIPQGGCPRALALATFALERLLHLGDDRVVVPLEAPVVVDEEERDAVLADGNGFDVSDKAAFDA